MSPGAVLGLADTLWSPHTNTQVRGNRKAAQKPFQNVTPARRCEPHLPPGLQPRAGKDLSGRARSSEGFELLLLMPKNPQTASRGRQAKGRACKSWERYVATCPSSYRRSKYLRFQVSTLPATPHILPGVQVRQGKQKPFAFSFTQSLHFSSQEPQPSLLCFQNSDAALKF